jgi:hypothetical protein
VKLLYADRSISMQPFMILLDEGDADNLVHNSSSHEDAFGYTTLLLPNLINTYRIFPQTSKSYKYRALLHV